MTISIVFTIFAKPNLLNMKKILLLFSLILALAAAQVNAQTTVFYESFDGNEFTGGNDGKWSGSVASGATISTDNEGWTFGGNCYGANYCIRLGSGKSTGSATTPALTQLSSDAILSFRAGSWGTDNTVLSVSISGGGSIDQSTIELQNSVFNTYTVNITGGTPSTTITFTSSGSGKRFFLDEIKVESTVTISQVSSLYELREVEDGGLVYLTFPKSNPGLIEYADKGNIVNAYVRDNTSSVRFANFLPSDAGWHTDTGGALIGAVLGEYHFNNGMPEFTHVSKSIADSILCLDHYHTPTPHIVNNLSNITGDTYRADFVELSDVNISNVGGLYSVEKDGIKIPLVDKFDISYNIPYDLKGRHFIINGILGCNDAGTSSELYYIDIEEIMPQLALDESLNTNGNTIGTYNGREVNITVNRKLNTGMWNTICLPFDIEGFSSIVSSSRLAELKEYNASTNSLEFKSTENLTAGVPYLVFPEEEVSNIVINGAIINSELTPVNVATYTFKGIFDPTTLYAGDTNVLFLGEGNKLYYPNVTNELKAFHAYFETSTGNSANICIDGISSGITTASIDNINDNSMIYNVSGQSVGTSLEQLPKGVYVRSGNKIIIK